MRPCPKGVILFIAAAFIALPGVSFAQHLTKTPVPRGGVTGLELGLEGATSVPRGGTLRWFFTLYEVVGHDALRPARNGTLRILASHRPDDVVAELRTDGRGRADVAIDVPANGIFGFDVSIEARSGRVSRTFTTSVSTENSARLELFVDRSSAQPGEQVTVVGRVVSAVTGRPMPGEAVSIDIDDQDDRSLTTDRTLETSSSGAFVTTVDVMPQISSLEISAHHEEAGEATASVAVSTPSAPRMVVRAVPLQQLVQPGAHVPIDVMVRRADGRPVEGASVSIDGQRVERRPPQTNEAGRARITWIAPDEVGGEPIHDLTRAVTVHRGGLGDARTDFAVRVAREERLIGVSVEGGGLTPNLPSKLFVRVINSDGGPAKNTAVQLASSLMGQLQGQTNDDGIVVFDARPRVTQGIEGRDRCGGSTSSSALIEVGTNGDAMRVERCVPIDPDATIRVRPSLHLYPAGTDVELELFVAARASRAPIEVALLARNDEQLVPMVRLVTPAGNRNVTIPLPDGLVGEVLVRARPLIGTTLEPVRGGTALIWVTPGERLSTSIVSSPAPDREGVFLQPSEQQADTESVLLVVPAHEGEPLAERVATAMFPPFGRVLSAPSRVEGPLLEGWLAVRTPRDEAAPAVLRDRNVVVLPAPSSPESLGLLRDPVRARARYVRGRLALVVRTLEQRLEESLPDRVADVGVHSARGWEFNREALTAVIGAHLLSGRVPMTLGGEDLTLDDLEDLDRAFTFDNMARRVTRERLLGLMIHLRDFVRTRELDLWQPVGDPAHWLRLVSEESGFGEGALLDGWGQPMTIRSAPGGHARFTFLTPLPSGYELVSAGPDGRFGTGDDVFDPFARVLPSGSAYAEAVGEDDLLTRLHRVELSQATLSEVVRLCEAMAGHEPEGAVATAARAWSEVPETLTSIDGADAFERSWLPIERGPAQLSMTNTAQSIPIDVGDEPRTYSLVGVTFTSDGWVDIVRDHHSSGFQVLLNVEPLERLRPGEPLLLPVSVARLPGGPQNLLISAEADGVVQVQIEGDGREASLLLGPGGGGEALLRVWAEEEGRGTVRIAVGDGDSEERRVVELPLQVWESGLLRRQSAAAAVQTSESIRVELPRNASAERGVLVLNGPNTFMGDPTLTPWLERDPALLAWAMAVSGQELPESLVQNLEDVTGTNGRVDGTLPSLSTACAAVAWAAATEGIHWAEEATASRVSDSEGAPEGLSTDAALLAALSVAVGPDDGSTLSTTIGALRDRLRSGARRSRDNRAILARGAAALLLADRRDIRGRTMFALARRQLEPGFRGGLVVSLDEESAGGVTGRASADQVVSTAALAIAAHQTGDNELARQLGQGLAARAHVATALGGETLFWFLAARAFGVFGTADSLEVTVEQGDTRRAVQIGSESVSIPLDLPRPGREAELRISYAGRQEAIPLAHTVATYVRPVRSASEGPLRATLEGDVGFAGERSAYVITLSNESEDVVDRSVLLVTLPAGARLDDTAINALSRTAGVANVDEADRRGVVRIELGSVFPETQRRLPLPVVWTAAGRQRGLGLAAFPEDRAWEISVTPEMTANVTFRDDLEL